MIFVAFTFGTMVGAAFFAAIMWTADAVMSRGDDDGEDASP